MKRELINDLFSKFEQSKQTIKDTHCWSARALSIHPRYSDWRNFLKVVEKSKLSYENVEGIVQDHFFDVTKMVDLGSGAQRPVDDIILYRYAFYPIAQNGDPSKPPYSIFHPKGTYEYPGKNLFRSNPVP